MGILLLSLILDTLLFDMMIENSVGFCIPPMMMGRGDSKRVVIYAAAVREGGRVCDLR